MSRESYMDTFHPLKLGRGGALLREPAAANCGDILVDSVVGQGPELIVTSGVRQVSVVCMQECLLDMVRAGVPDGGVGREGGFGPGRCGVPGGRLAIKGSEGVKPVGGSRADGKLEVVEGRDDEKGGDRRADITSGPVTAGEG